MGNTACPCGAGRVYDQVAPVHVPPLYATVPAQLRFATAVAVMPASCVEVRLDGAYPNVGVLHEAGMPLAPSTQPKPSVAALVDVHDEPHDRSFFPEIRAQWPLGHCALLVQ